MDEFEKKMFPPELLDRVSRNLAAQGPLPLDRAQALADALINHETDYMRSRAREEGIPQVDAMAMLASLRDTLVLMFTGQLSPVEVVRATKRIGEKQADVAYEREHGRR